MKKSQLILGLVVLAALGGLALWARQRVHFDFAVFRAQVTLADWRMILAGMGCIYLGYVFRSARWALLLRHHKKVSPFTLVGTQVMGFTAVALIGRVADPVRPYLVAKKTGLPLGSQIAVYIVERLMDAGSMALIFSIAMIWVPTDQILAVTANSGFLGFLGQLALHHRVLAPLVARFGGLALTVAGAIFLIVVRLSGGAVAAFFERVLHPLSANLAQSVGDKIRAFNSGLDTMRSFGDFAIVASLSIAMWLLIMFAYLLGTRAFVASPELASITLPKCVLLMIASGGASIVQLPVLGWFSQIGIVALALAAVLGASAEAATACAAILLLITFLCIIPTGLIWAQFEHVSLRKVAAESGQVEEAMAGDKPVSAAE